MNNKFVVLFIGMEQISLIPRIESIKQISNSAADTIILLMHLAMNGQQESTWVQMASSTIINQVLNEQ